MTDLAGCWCIMSNNRLRAQIPNKVVSDKGVMLVIAGAKQSITDARGLFHVALRMSPNLGWVIDN